MATNRDLLKEAIADAKAVKETAIANAKAALEEAFTPQLKSMFAAKLQEMEHENELEEAKDIEEMDEALGTINDPDTPTAHGNIAEEDKDMMEIDLEELLKELELEEGDMEGSLNEAEGDDEEDMPMSDEDSDEGDEEGTPLDLEDMTDEDLKDMIEDVIKDMIASGELEAGHEGMGDEEGMEVKDEEVDLAELLREIEEMEHKTKEEGMHEEKEPVDEYYAGGASVAPLDFAIGAAIAALGLGIPIGRTYFNYLKAKKAEKKAEGKSEAELDQMAKDDAEFEKDVTNVINKASSKVSTELSEAYKTIKALKSELNEINLLNAKLLYTNKIFKSKNLNESQKVKVLSSFDKATTVGEVKLVFETLNEGIKVAKNTIKENLGSASKATITPNVKKPIVESNDAFLRMQKLAGII
jgi:hypothetical protein